MSKPHGNSKKNKRPHHLYEIGDKELNDTFKYGISCEPIGKDGISERARIQLDLMNLIAGWARYFVRILIRNIPDNAKARIIEKEFIATYKRKHGRNPIGNKERKKKPPK